MINTCLSKHSTTVVFASVLLSFLSFLLDAPSSAAPPPAALRFNPAALPPPPPNLGNPSGRGAGGRRGCTASANAKPVTALVPIVQTGDKQLLWGTTTQTYPTFWLQFPEPLPQGALVELTLIQSSTADPNATQYQVPPLTAGIVRLAVPSTAAPLQENQPYQWKIAIYCNSGAMSAAAFSDPSADAPIVLRGGIQRVAPSSSVRRQLAAATTPIELATLYANSGVWYDALTVVGMQAQTQSTPDVAIARAWRDLLQQINLDSANTPILPCCTAK